MTANGDPPAATLLGRVAVLHVADRIAAEAAAAVADRMRRQGHDVVEVDGTSLDPFADHRAEWQHLLADGPLSGVVSVGGINPAAVGLATTAGAALRVTASHHQAVSTSDAATTIQTVPVLRIEVDHRHRLTIDPVTVTTAVRHSWGWRSGAHWHLAPAASSWHANATAPGVVVHADHHPERLVDAITMEARDAGLRAEIDRRSRRATTVRIDLSPKPLHLLLPAGPRVP